MAEIEVFEVAEEALDAMEADASELSEEVQEEIKAEVSEARAEIEKLSDVQSKFKNILSAIGSGLSYVARFTAQNVAIGVILWAVNVTLNKVYKEAPQKTSESTKRMRNVIKALCGVITTEAQINKKALDWMKVHQDDTIDLEGIEILMEDILKTHLKPIIEANDEAKNIADSLQETVDGKLQFKCPKVYDIKKLIEITGMFIQAFSDLINFIHEKEAKVKELQSFPLKQGDLDDLRQKLSEVNALPLWDE